MNIYCLKKNANSLALKTLTNYFFSLILPDQPPISWLCQAHFQPPTNPGPQKETFPLSLLFKVKVNSIHSTDLFSIVLTAANTEYSVLGFILSTSCVLAHLLLK